MYRDRQDAGRQLAAACAHLRDERPIVLGLPRGGVIVAAPVASALDAPLDVLVVRKVGAPGRPELAVGAVTNGTAPQRVVNRAIVRALGVDDAWLDAESARQLEAVREREARYRAGRPAVPVEGRTVVVVDDGIATGATVKAALQAVRGREPSRLVLAVPVAAPESLRSLATLVDELICVERPRHFHAVGEFYERFEQTTDSEVESALRAT